MKHLEVYILLLLSIYYQSVVQAQWVITKFPGTLNPIHLAVNGAYIFAVDFGNGVFYSTDNGTNWIIINNGLPLYNHYVNSIVVNGTNIFVGAQGNGSDSIGVYLSTNNGTNWKLVNHTNSTVSCLAVSGTNIFAGTQSDGVFRSTNNGTNWTQINIGLTSNIVWSFAIKGTNIFAGTDKGVYLSTNNGSNWTLVNNGLNDEVLSLTISGNNIFAGSSNSSVYLSTNNGLNWTWVYNNMPYLTKVYSLTTISASIFAGTDHGVYRSLNNGISWDLEDEGLLFGYGVSSFVFNDNYIFASTLGYGIYKRPISELVPTLLMISPNGGENWQAGSIQTVGWISTFISDVKIEYTTNNGTDWKTVIASTPASLGSYDWIIPNTPSVKCKVRISDVSNSILSDTSANSFIISEQPSISVISPVAGSIWVAGTPQNIKWTTINVTGNVNIKLDTDGSTSFPITLKSNTPNDSSEIITVPDDSSNTCRILVESVDNISVFGTNNGIFTISIPSIKVNSPNGGEICDTGSIFKITWESKYVANVKIEYSINNGASWSIINSSYSSTGTFDWNVANIPSTQCKIKISDASNGSWYDESDNVFTISANATGIRDLLNPHPTQFSLYQNFPNPFNPVSRIYYSVPKESHVTIKLYNTLGQEIMVLVNETKSTGNYWININGSQLKSGVYIYHMKAGIFNQTKKMILLK